MGDFIFKNKGFKEIYLTRNYNSFSPQTFNIDNVRFNETPNPFSDYCFQVTCGVWQNDKIKILTLPDKGILYYLTNPGSSTLIYAPVFIGQMILVRDLIDFKVLKFNAKENQFNGNYLTEFKIERFCGSQSNNIIALVKLNMIDVRVPLEQRYEIYIPQTCSTVGSSPTNYNVYCEGSVSFTFASLLNLSAGFIRMMSDPNSNELYITKQDGTALVLYEILPVSQDLKAVLSANGVNDPSVYPIGYPSQPFPSIYVFEYSVDGISSWTNFNIYIANA